MSLVGLPAEALAKAGGEGDLRAHSLNAWIDWFFLISGLSIYPHKYPHFIL